MPSHEFEPRRRRLLRGAAASLAGLHLTGLARAAERGVGGSEILLGQSVGGGIDRMGRVSAWRFINPPVTPLMILRHFQEEEDLRKRWRDANEIAPEFLLAVVAAEDQKFFQHSGFDWQQIQAALDERRAGGRLRGGSTISQQVAKNVFLWPGRSWIRKGLEAWFTVLVENIWGKHRIMEVYLNVAEFAPGVYGAEAGALARHLFLNRPQGDYALKGPQDYLTEIHAQGEGFIRMLADRLERGAAFLLDYGFGEDEYYHPQRHMGTVMCHQGHLADGDPLVDVGRKDITAHVNFTAMALAAQEAGMQVLGYTTQAHFLMNCGLLSNMEQSADAERALALKLIHEHEMGEFFKVIGLCKGEPWDALGFVQGDRTHRL